MNLDEYKRSGRELYERFAAAVAELLKRAIGEDPGFRLQQIQHRAKTVKSLSRRLKEDNEYASAVIEAHRKDLAGCRIIFYTNNDVNRFTQSGILGDLLDVDWERSKFHQPKPGEESTAELFQSFNYVVKLKADRAALLEYREFEGLCCEIQVQTILNHAWAEMAHDTIYKRPESPGFGSSELKQIEKKLGEVMREYLLPAGYLFQSIASDVQRLAEGKALFDAGILDAILDAKDNNDRRTAVVRLKESVLPSYDDPRTVYPEIRDKLKEAWRLAERTETVPFEGTLGEFGGIEPHQVTAEIAAIITRYRYIEPDETYALIRSLYVETSNVESRKQLIRTAESLASHTLQVWQQSGPVIQVILAELLSNENDIASIAPLAITIANKILEPDIEGMTSTSNSVTISQGAIVHSDALAKARRTVIDVIDTCAQSVINDDELLRNAVECLIAAGQMPRHGAASPDTAGMICSDLAYALERITKFAADASLNLRQDIESQLLQRWRWNKSLPQDLNSSPSVASAHKRFVENTIQLRETLNADEEFLVFKAIVGYKSVFPHMWGDGSINFDRDQAIRRQEQERLADRITNESWSLWKSRLATAAEVQSNNGMTFPPFIQFLAILANRHQDLALDLLSDRDVMPSWTIRPIAEPLLGGILQPEVEAMLNRWLDEKQFLQEIAGVIAHSDCVDAATVQTRR